MAVIGFGFMGVVHAKNIIASEKLELCGIIDTREGDIFAGIETAGNAGELDLPFEKLRQTTVYQSLNDCLQEQKIDAVSICVPLLLHYKIAKEALELGLDVLLEKPFCPEVEQCRELIDLTKAKNCILMVAHCLRFAPEYEFLAECIKDKRYGELKLLTTNRLGGEPNWGVWKDEKIKKTCGGALMDLLIHDIDFANYCLGEPESISVNTKCDEYWEIPVKYKNTKAIVSIKGGFLHINSAFSAEYTATFENASIRYATTKPGLIEIGTSSRAEQISLNGDMYERELDYFADCIIHRNIPEKCSPESSILSINNCQKTNQMASLKAPL